MSTAEVLSPLPPPIPYDGAVSFLGEEEAYWRLRIKGAALVLLTLGIYRFWLATDVRRYLWSNTEVAGETLEYNGLATELVIGFLLALAILVPLYTVIGIVALELGLLAISSVLTGFLLLVLLGEFSLYRARRYRLTRTVFRGLRFDQHGSAWLYSLYALLWWVAAILTLGLAYPWSQASLQRFKLRHTSYGDLPGRFEGSGALLFLRGLPLWLAVVAPLFVAIAALGNMVDWDALSTAMTQGDEDALKRFQNSREFTVALGTVGTAVFASIVLAALLYPLFQAIHLRWWISGLRFGDVTVRSRLRAGKVYRVYLRFLLYLALFAVLAAVAGGLCLMIVGVLISPGHDSGAAEMAATVLLVGAYVIGALAISTIYQVVVTAALWRLGAQSAELSGARALETVRAAGAPASALGEGLADALHVGGI